MKAVLNDTSKMGERSTKEIDYSDFHFLDDFIEYIVNYCRSVFYGDMDNIEVIKEVALSWLEKGIYTVEAANEEISAQNEATSHIKCAYGNNKKIGENEKGRVLKWIDVYGFDSDEIFKICKKICKERYCKSLKELSDVKSNGTKKSDAYLNEELKKKILSVLEEDSGTFEQITFKLMRMYPFITNLALSLVIN